MVRKVFSRPIRFLPLVIAFATCHFSVFAVCYFFYRRSYYLAPTVFQSLCGVVTLILEASPRRVSSPNSTPIHGTGTFSPRYPS